jgi:hypothetical protein
MMFKSVIVLAMEDVEVHLHTLQTMTEQFQLCEWGSLTSWKTALFGNVWHHGMQLITQPVHVLHCSNSAMKGSTESHDISAQTITEPPCFIVGTRHSGL